MPSTVEQWHKHVTDVNKKFKISTGMETNYAFPFVQTNAGGMEEKACKCILLCQRRVI